MVSTIENHVFKTKFSKLFSKDLNTTLEIEWWLKVYKNFKVDLCTKTWILLFLSKQKLLLYKDGNCLLALEFLS